MQGQDELLLEGERKAARERQAPPRAGVNLNFAGVDPATAKMSVLTTAPTALATMAPRATPDYFAVPNFANSPLPQIDPNTGAIVPGTGIRKFINQLPGLCPLSPQNNLGQCIPLAVPDTTTFPGSDFYRIGLRDDTTQKLSGDLPPTKFRGYVQLDAAGNPVSVVDANSAPVASQQYLGPLILATRDRPVRVLFQNEVKANAGLFLPVDTTYMGAGLNSSPDGTIMETASEDRAELHLHGGNSIWISDGTPHQWVTPPKETVTNAPNFAKGVSFQNVPDMPAKLGYTPSLTDGKATYFWTNQQSGRLMFFHDHAYGITRLDVYAGEAAGYLLVDPAQEAKLQAATVPGAIPNPANLADPANDLTHVIPLVIQDKTFVPDDGAPGGQLAATDPTWDVAKYGGKGSLWFPHVYMTNQNPYDPSGANALGRWDYGPWMWPPQTGIVYPPVPCTSAAYPGQNLTCPGIPNPTGVPEGFMDTPLVNGTAYPTLTVDPVAYRFHILSIGNDRSLNLSLFVADPLKVSVTKGGSGYTKPVVTINDATCTSGLTAAATVVNGAITAITVSGTPNAHCTNPTLTITDPNQAAAGAVAIASADTDVKMVPAVPSTARTLPDCTTRLSMSAGGLPAAALDANGHPLNKTGLYPNCWPTYSGMSGDVPWPDDGRDGGVPDPTTAGPPFIQIGTEGGLQPNVVVIPATAVGFDYNRRNVTVLNVLAHGLLLEPAERADAIVDFSQFAGKTLIMYNDSPEPYPGLDPRTDYYTNDPDNSPSGGAPSTVAGYGPNTRTLVQIKVKATGGTPTFSLPTLTAALPGIFADTQDKIIMPETAYPAKNGGAAGDTYFRIGDETFTGWIGNGIGGLTLTNGGTGYTDVPLVTIDPPAKGTAATATTLLAPTGVGALTLTAGGGGYTSAPTVTFSAPPAGGKTATGTATVANGQVTAISLTDGGSGYIAPPTITFSGGGGAGAAATALLAPTVVQGFNITQDGTGYTSAPAVQITGGNGNGAAATASPPVTPLQPKTIAELFTWDYGRMNALLGVEMAFSTYQQVTTIPYGYADPPTELLKDGETQIWKIAHNGVDTHSIHVHLFTAQVINRVGMDGMIKPPDPNELAWKDTIRMNPLEAVIIAVRPMRQIDALGITAPAGQPFQLPNSVRLMDVTMPKGSSNATHPYEFTNLDVQSQPAPVTNDFVNYGWEYVWHCHILGHEENDMMRATAMGAAPVTPGRPKVLEGRQGNTRFNDVTWEDRSINETGFTIQRATSANGPWTAVGTAASPAPTGKGGAVTFRDTTVAAGVAYYYRVIANNVIGYTQAYAAPAVGYPSRSVDSAPSATAKPFYVYLPQVYRHK